MENPYRTSLFTFVDFNFLDKEGEIYSPDPYVLFISKLHEEFSESCLASRVAGDVSESASAEYEWPEELDFLRLSHKNTFHLFTKRVLSIRRNMETLYSKAAGYDNLLLCWPHPISYLIAKNFESRKNIFLLVRQNQTEITKAKYQGVKRKFAMIGLQYLDNKLEHMKKSIRIITVGEEMNRHFLSRGFDSELISDSLIPQSCKGYPRSFPKSFAKLLYVGRLEKEKGGDMLLYACAILKKVGLNFHLNIIGTGSQGQALKELSDKLDLEKFVSFRGHVRHGESLFAYFQAADLLVIPSRTEGFPKTIHEARAFGLPLVATPVGGMYAELKHGVNAWFSKDVDAESVGSSIVELLNDQKSYAEISKNLLKEFDKNSMEFALAKYFNKIIE